MIVAHQVHSDKTGMMKLGEKQRVGALRSSARVRKALEAPGA